MTSDDDEGDELEILKVAFGESVRKLEAIHRAAESLRSRAGLVLGAATAVGAFAGGLALDRGPSGLEWLLVVAGLAAYAGALGLSLQTILPQEGAGRRARTRRNSRGQRRVNRPDVFTDDWRSGTRKASTGASNGCAA